MNRLVLLLELIEPDHCILIYDKSNRENTSDLMFYTGASARPLLREFVYDFIER